MYPARCHPDIAIIVRFAGAFFWGQPVGEERSQRLHVLSDGQTIRYTTAGRIHPYAEEVLNVIGLSVTGLYLKMLGYLFTSSVAQFCPFDQLHIAMAVNSWGWMRRRKHRFSWSTGILTFHVGIP